MAAYFFTANNQTYIISNTMSIYNAGFHLCKSYYNVHGDTLTYYHHDNGAILSVISRRRHQSVKTFYRSKEEANESFKRFNAGRTFQDGKWVSERKR